jgi:hypothetical protein
MGWLQLPYGSVTPTLLKLCRCVVVKDIGIAKWKVVVITVCLMYFTLSLARYVIVIQLCSPPSENIYGVIL